MRVVLDDGDAALGRDAIVVEDGASGETDLALITERVGRARGEWTK